MTSSIGQKPYLRLLATCDEMLLWMIEIWMENHLVSDSNCNTINLYSNLSLKYALWTKVVGAHLVGKCILYAYRFLDPLIQCIAMGNGWNLRQPAWLKPNDVKPLQSWASRTRRASKRWGGGMQSLKVPSRKSRTIGRRNCNEIQPIRTFAKSESATGFKGFEALHNIVLGIDIQLLCSNVRTEGWQMYDELQQSFEMIQRNVN
jgi:hypothetical protein